MGRLIFIVALFCSLSAHGQKIALLSTDLKSPILYTDSVTIEQVSSGHFAIDVNNLDTFVASLAYMRDLLKKTARSKLESWEFRSGNTIIMTSRIPNAYGDSYSVMAVSKFDEVTSTFDLTPEKGSKKKSEHIDRALKYIEKNRTVLRQWYEITPKKYNVIVIKG